MFFMLAASVVLLWYGMIGLIYIGDKISKKAVWTEELLIIAFMSTVGTVMGLVALLIG